MTPHTLIALYCLAIIAVSLAWWLIAKSRLRRQRINQLKENDLVTVCGIKATYLYRVGRDVHKVLIDTTVHDIHTNLIKIK